MARLKAAGSHPELLAELEADFPYMALDTCAVDGLCATACPVSIDTGQLTKHLRQLRHSPTAHARAGWAAEHFQLVENMARWGLRLGHFAQAVLGVGVTRWLSRKLTGLAWTRDVPHSRRARLPHTEKAMAQAVYFPSCISRVMGRLPGEDKDMSPAEALLLLADRAGVPVYVPEDAAGVCCGVPFSSKGFDQAHRFAINRAIESFWRWSERGRLPVVLDTSPCAYGLLHSRPSLTPENQRRFDKMRILDSIVFVHDQFLPKLAVIAKAEAVVLHPVCSVSKMGIGDKLEAIARACAERVVIPASAGCCGFAGDRGFLFPELTESATRLEAAEIQGSEFDGYFSSSRTCEIGMTRATGHVYRSFVHLLERATRK
jgi:D-lactate dehydrogenase